MKNYTETTHLIHITEINIEQIHVIHYVNNTFNWEWGGGYRV